MFKVRSGEGEAPGFGERALDRLSRVLTVLLSPGCCRSLSLQVNFFWSYPKLVEVSPGNQGREGKCESQIAGGRTTDPTLPALHLSGLAQVIASGLG